MLLSIEIPETPPRKTSSVSSIDSYNLLSIDRSKTPPVSVSIPIQIPKSKSYLNLNELPPPPTYPPPEPKS